MKINRQHQHLLYYTQSSCSFGWQLNFLYPFVLYAQYVAPQNVVFSTLKYWPKISKIKLNEKVSHIFEHYLFSMRGENLASELKFILAVVLLVSHFLSTIEYRLFAHTKCILWNLQTYATSGKAFDILFVV